MSDTTYTLPVGRDSLWSGRDQPSHVTGKLVFRVMHFTATDGTPDRWLHARLYFDPTLWDVDKHGLIYTDELFIETLHARLRATGWTNPERSINYSEAGMQGDNYVDFDVSTDKDTLMDLLISNTSVHARWPEHVREHATT